MPERFTDRPAPESGTTRTHHAGQHGFSHENRSDGDFTELAAALLPCMWSFSEIGQRLATRSASGDKRYGRWIAMYSSKEFAELAEWCRGLLEMHGPKSIRSSLSFAPIGYRKHGAPGCGIDTAVNCLILGRRARWN